MDDETRFWIAQEVGNRKEGHNARGLLQKAKQRHRTNIFLQLSDDRNSCGHYGGNKLFIQEMQKNIWN